MSFLSTTLRAGGRGEILQIDGFCKGKSDSGRESSKKLKLLAGFVLCEQSALQSESDKIGAFPQSELLHQAGAVGLH